MQENKYTYNKWDNFELPQLTENDYGIEWPRGIAQVTKELLCFKKCWEREKGFPDMLGTFNHFLNIVRYLWPNDIHIYKDVKKGGIYKDNGRIWNNYFLDVAYKLCTSKKKRRCICGPASATKTHTVALYDFVTWISSPGDTLVMISTTSGVASERRIWAPIKEFYRKAEWEACGIEPIGEIIEYLKAIVFDPDKQLGGSDTNRRDFRNAIIVIPIANDSTGDGALSTIQGSKNRRVIWTIDEMAKMPHGVTRPNANLSQNTFFEFTGIANSEDENDPHGKYCMPKEGLAGLNVDIDREWISAKGVDVLFLHGEETPNNHPLIDQSKIEQPVDYPFSYASNPFTANEVAEELGDGDAETGKQTIDYWKFQIGFWAPANASNSLYSKNLFTSNNANLPHERLIHGVRKFGAGDFAFSVGGDDNTLYHAEVGYAQSGQKYINFAKDTKSIKVNATAKEEFIKSTAKEYVKNLQELNVRPEDFGGDTGNDAALMLNEMSREAKTHDFVGISSIGSANNSDKYFNKVTELWFQVRDLIKTGLCRGINFQSKYFAQLCDRKYESLSKNYYKIERKKDMKKRIGRSPDDADAFIYVCYMIIRSGLFADEIAKAREIRDSEEEAREHLVDPYSDVFNRYQEQDSQSTEFGGLESEYESVF